MLIKRIISIMAAIITLLANLIGINIPNDNKVDSFKVTSYVIADRIQSKDDLCSEDFDIITDVILFGCATFDSEGNVNYDEEILETALSNLRQVIAGRDVGITLNLLGPGYTGDSPVWEDQMNGQTQEHNKAFTSGVLEDNIIAVLDKYDFDGVHFDYEYPVTLNAWVYFNAFLVKLDKKLKDYTLGVATNEWNLYFTSMALEAVDTLELMMYDVYDDEGKHSTYETVTELVKKVDLAGVPLEKVNLGLPFYARPSDKSTYWYDYKGYSDKLDENNWYHDEELDKDFWFNTPDITQAKTQFAIDKGYGGVMMWHYTCDHPSTNENSLLRAVGKAVSNSYN